MELILLFCGPGVLLFAIELAVLRCTRRAMRSLRFLPLILLLVPCAIAVQCWREGGWFWEVGVFCYLAIAGIMLADWGLAWIGRPRGNREERGGDSHD
ncbi:MAG: hypothetical protein EOM52_07815 [Clostridia bacterium]|nr:hypothetical protein [Clostridia bacterium]